MNIDDDILKKASELTGVGEKTALVRMGLETLIARRSAQRLAALGGAPSQKHGPRHDGDPNGDPRRYLGLDRSRVRETYLEGVDMTTVAIEEAQHSLPQLIDVVAHGEHVFITRDQVTVAELVPVNRAAPKPTFGSAEGLIKMSDDFDASVKDFQEYME